MDKKIAALLCSLINISAANAQLSDDKKTVTLPTELLNRIDSVLIYGGTRNEVHSLSVELNNYLEYTTAVNKLQAQVQDLKTQLDASKEAEKKIKEQTSGSPGSPETPHASAPQNP